MKSLDGNTLVLAERSGETLTLVLADNLSVNEVVPIEPAAIPDNVPVVTFKPGDRSLLVPGAKVLVTAQLRDGKLMALRLAGRDGFVPPM